MQDFNILETLFNDSILLHKNRVMNMNLLITKCFLTLCKLFIRLGLVKEVSLTYIVVK